jgi:CheY-like chemotaxis protein
MDAASNDFPSRYEVLRNRRILVVEDEPLMAMLLESGLLNAAAEIVGPAASVYEALRLVEQVSCDGGLSAAVLDVNLQIATAEPTSAPRC